MIKQLEICNNIERQESKKDGFMTDVFDGLCYSAAENKELFSNNLDIAVALYTDGFSKYSTMTIIHFIILKFPRLYQDRTKIHVAVMHYSIGAQEYI